MKYLDRDDLLLLAVTVVIAAAGLMCGSWWAPVVYAPTWGLMAFVAFHRRRQCIEEVKRRLSGGGGI